MLYVDNLYVGMCRVNSLSTSYLDIWNVRC